MSEHTNLKSTVVCVIVVIWTSVISGGLVSFWMMLNLRVLFGRLKMSLLTPISSRLTFPDWTVSFSVIVVFVK